MKTSAAILILLLAISATGRHLLSTVTDDPPKCGDRVCVEGEHCCHVHRKRHDDYDICVMKNATCLGLLTSLQRQGHCTCPNDVPVVDVPTSDAPVSNTPIEALVEKRSLVEETNVTIGDCKRCCKSCSNYGLCCHCLNAEPGLVGLSCNCLLCGVGEAPIFCEDKTCADGDKCCKAPAQDGLPPQTTCVRMDQQCPF